MMLTDDQEQIIIRYLLDKRLTLNVAAEVFDHMVLEVSGLMQKKELPFDEAWAATKKAWFNEMRTMYDAFYSLDDITMLMRKLKKQKMKGVFKKTLFIAAFSTVVLVGLMFSFNQWSLWIFISLMIAVYFLTVGVSLKEALKLRRIQKQFPDNRLTIDSDWLSVPASGIGSAFIIIVQLLLWKKVVTLSVADFVARDFAFGPILGLFMIFALASLISFFWIVKRRFEKKWNHLQPFLNKIG